MSESANDWLRIAEDDLQASALLQRFEEFPTAIHTFHCQQAVEKSLKAFLAARARHFMARQNLAYLLGLCAEVDASFRQWETHIAALAPFTTQSIYPTDAKLAPSPAQARALYEQANGVVSFVKAKLKSNAGQ